MVATTSVDEMVMITALVSITLDCVVKNSLHGTSSSHYLFRMSAGTIWLQQELRQFFC